jgi:hypothetical protein
VRGGGLKMGIVGLVGRVPGEDDGPGDEVEYNDVGADGGVVESQIRMVGRGVW